MNRTSISDSKNRGLLYKFHFLEIPLPVFYFDFDPQLYALSSINLQDYQCPQLLLPNRALQMYKWFL